MLLEVDRRLKKLDATIGSLRGAMIDEAHLAMIFELLCIRISGNIEIGVNEILRTYTSQHAGKQVIRYVERRLARFQNPKCQRIVEVLSDFSEEWGSRFSEFASRDDMKDQIDSIAANRNLIAHGRPTGVSATRVAAFNETHKKTLTFIDRMVLPAE